MLQESKTLVGRIKSANQKGRPFVVDAVGIGAGVNNTLAFSALGQANPDARVLVFEGNSTTSVFDEMSGAFRVNSIETEEFSANFFSTSPIQPRDFNPHNEPYVSSKVFGDILKLSIHNAGIPVAFEQPVASVEIQPEGKKWPARYKIKTTRGLVVFANQVIAGTGMGRPNVAVGDEKTQALLRKYEDESEMHFKSGDLKFVPGIESVDSFLRRSAAVAKKSGSAISESKGLTVGVIGGGDGGNIAIEALTGLNPELNPHGQSGAQVVWVGRHRNKADFLKQFDDDPDEAWFPSYLNEVRKKRYEHIAPLIDSGQVKPQAGRMESVEVVQATSSTKKPAKKYVITSTNQKGELTKTQVDRVILATGYRNEVEKLFPLPADQAERVFADTADCTMNKKQCGHLPVARKYRGEDLWVVGNATDQWQERILEKSHWSSTHGGGNLDILASRSATAGRMIGQQLSHQIEEKHSVPSEIKPHPNASFVFYQPAQARHGARSQNDPSVQYIRAKLKIAKILGQFRTSQPGAELEIQMDSERSGGLAVTVKGLDEPSAQAIHQALADAPGLFDHLEHLFGESRSVILSVPTREDGTFRIENMALTQSGHKIR